MLRLYDTQTREVRDFVPLEEGQAGLYVCGLTVQSEPHVGHVRSAVNFDVLQRWLRRNDYEVTFIRNTTDIDDKILVKAAEQGRPWYNLAYAMKRELDRAYEALNVAPPTYEPSATGHVPEMLELIGQLIAKGHAYAAADGSGDVYFDVRSWPSYGELTHQKIDDMEAAEDADPRGKRDPRDFALWKGWKKETEPETAAWPSPWGPGRPGWHIECSAMAGKYLGTAFDIHGGGVDLRFPHHENEQAQSRAAGHPFASYWMHNAWITTAGEKMSKSLGNSLLIPEVLKRVRGIELRYYIVAAHYRSHVEFSFDALDEAAAGFRRIENFLDRAGEGQPGELPEEFADGDGRRPWDAGRRRRAVRRRPRRQPPARRRSRRRHRRRAGTSDARRARPGPAGPGLAEQRRRRRQADRSRGRTGGRTPRAAHGRARGQGLRHRGRHPRPDQGRRHRDRGHPRRTEVEPELMPGNSQRKGSIRKTAKKPTAGSGGRVKRGLEGRGPTPKAKDRPYHQAHKAAKKKAATKSSATRPKRRNTTDAEWIAGRNSVVEALREGVPVNGVYVAEGAERDGRLREAFRLASERGISLLEVTKGELDRMTSGAVHQGLAARIPAYEYAHPDDLLDRAKELGEPPLVVALDQVTDPRNLGAAIRSAAAFGAHGVVIPERRAAGMTASAWKTSAGAAARIPVAQTVNLVRQLKSYQDAGCMVVGLAADGDISLPELDLADGPLVVVVGSEGDGLSRLVAETCDQLVSIPMVNQVESLNAGVAASVALYAVAQARG